MRTKKQVEKDLLHIEHMLHYGEVATKRYNKYKNGRWKEDVDALKDSLALCLIQVGDRMGKKHLSKEVREQFEFPRKDVQDRIRNVNAHEYGNQKTTQIFESIEEDLPIILNNLISIRTSLTNELEQIERTADKNDSKALNDKLDELENQKTQEKDSTKHDRTNNKNDEFFIDR